MASAVSRLNVSKTPSPVAMRTATQLVGRVVPQQGQGLRIARLAFVGAPGGAAVVVFTAHADQSGNPRGALGLAFITAPLTQAAAALGARDHVRAANLTRWMVASGALASNEGGATHDTPPTARAREPTTSFPIRTDGSPPQNGHGNGCSGFASRPPSSRIARLAVVAPVGAAVVVRATRAGRVAVRALVAVGAHGREHDPADVHSDAGARLRATAALAPVANDGRGAGH